MSQDAIGSLFAIVLLGAVAAFWIRAQLKRKRARTWPSTMGQVESTAVGLEGGGTNQSRYIAEVVYLYSARSQGYSGRLRCSFMLESRAKKWIGGYATGRPVSIRYNPENAGDSTMFEDEQAGAQGS